MKYELAKQLKDAGFPQGLTEHAYGWVEAHQAWEIDNGEMVNGVSAPTLSELIEDCGVEFDSLLNVTITESMPCFISEARNSDDKKIASGRGRTPEEAVAKLWLELNKK